MNILSKLPLIFSSFAFANSIAIPFVLNKEEAPQAMEEQKENNNLRVLKEAPRRAKMPSHVTVRFQDAMKYLDCVERDIKGKAEKELEEIKQKCRAKHWFWDV